VLPRHAKPDVEAPARPPATARVAEPTAREGCERFRPAAPAIHSERVLRIQGYSDLTRVRQVIRRAAEAMAAAAESLSRPEVAFRHVGVQSIRGDVLELQDGTRLHCQAFQRQLCGCTEIVPFVLTAGVAIGERVMELIESGDLLEGVLLETAGWLCIEDATRQFKARLRASSMRRNRRITSRMGPGYSYKVTGSMCTWPLEEQPALFGLFGDAELPVALMKSCAMNPKMSRSGIYGIAPLPPATSLARIGGRSVPEST
jgi:hypothetical protein